MVIVKKIATILIEAAKKNYNLKGTTLVLGTVFGPGDRSDHFIPSVIRRMQKNKKKFNAFGSGNESRDFIFVEDQVKGIFFHKDVNEEILNIGSGNLIKTKQMINILKKIMKYKGDIIYKIQVAPNMILKEECLLVKQKNLLVGFCI